MQPDLEVVQVGRNESFRAWSHGYPYKTVRWHFHPEYEVHLVTATSGSYLVGDYVGTFAPGNLVMTGPNLPHNWISNVSPGEAVPERSLVLQFTHEFIHGCMGLFPELDFVADLLSEARHGLSFGTTTATHIKPIFEDMVSALGPRRIELFIAVLGHLGQCRSRRRLATGDFRPEPDNYMSGAMNHVLVHIRENFTTDLREIDLAKLSALSPSSFSRSFRRHTGVNFVQFVNELRIEYACQLLMQAKMSITDICYEVGFNNVSNFNRQFLLRKKMSPSKYRSVHVLHSPSSISAA